jgi:hypothetical protein
MKSSAYAYAIATSHIDKRVNAFIMKELEKVINYNNVQSQGNELVPSGKFCINYNAF